MTNRGKWQPYSDYRDSGTEWLGEIPVHWGGIRLKFLVSKIGSGVTPKGGSEVYSESGVIFLRSQNVHPEGLSLDDVAFINDEIDAQMPSSRTYPQDVLLNITGASLGRCSLIPEGFPPANVNQHVCIIRPIQGKIEPGFLHSVMVSDVIQSQIFSDESGASREAVTYSEIGDFWLPLPNTLGEQRAIAAFLDRETAHIDALVDAKRRLIALLEEKRAALIGYVVAKGLDPTAPMCDSGIVALGLIPSHWAVKKVKHISRVFRGKFSHRPRNDPRLYEGPYPFVQTGDIATAGKYVTEYQQTLNDEGLAVSEMFPANTLVMTIAANIGDLAILDFPACFPDSVVGFNPVLETDLNYLYYNLTALRADLERNATQNTQQNLNVGIIGNCFTVLPQVDEQRNIGQYLDSATEEMDKITHKVGEAIEILLEYRTALISAAVTGKIDVRGEVG